MKVFVITHKTDNFNINKEGYETLLVGAYNKESSNMSRDDIGDNISDKNQNYCELTGLYWMWKNCNEDIVGLCHYRRFFSNSMFSKSKNKFLSQDEIKTLLNKYDIILPKKELLLKTNKESYNIAPNAQDMDIVRNIVKEKYPEYYNDLIKFENSKYRYAYNMLITKKEILDKYCEWLFSILSECEKVMIIDNNDKYRRRMYGFLSERLIAVWVAKNNLKIKESYVVNTEKTRLENFKYYIKQYIKSVFIHNKM